MNPATRSQELLRQLASPSQPYRGVASFRLIDRNIFTGRPEEQQQVFRLLCVYRGVLLHGDSGCGKSSLVNARLIPDLIEEGFEVERLRVQPVSNEEIVVERILIDESPDAAALPSLFTEAKHNAGDKPTLDLGEFEAALAGRPDDATRILIFDQFEELVTQFEDAQVNRTAYESAKKRQKAIVAVLQRLLTDTSVRVKLLFVFRDDYFARLAELFPNLPQLKDQSLHLTSPPVGSLAGIIGEPFVKLEFPKALDERTRQHLIEGFTQHSTNGLINLTEVQIACASVWEDPDENRSFLSIDDPKAAVQSIFDNFVPRSIARLPVSERNTATEALCLLITPASPTAIGTRNIVSEVNLLDALAEDGHPRELSVAALSSLSRSARLVFRQTRGLTPFYEIVSEFLVQGIAAKREGVEKARKAREAAMLQAEVDKRTKELVVKTNELDHQASKLIAKTRALKLGAGLLALVMLGAFYAAYRAKANAVAALSASDELTRVNEELKWEIGERERAQEAEQETKLRATEGQIRQLQAQAESRASEAEALAKQLEELKSKSQTGEVTALDIATVIDKVEDPLVSRLAGATMSIRSAAYSPDGRFIALGSEDKKIRLWSRLGGEPLAQASGSSSLGGITSLAFSADSTFLLSGSAGRSLRLFDPRLSDLGTARQFDFHPDTVTQIAFSPAGELSASAGSDGAGGGVVVLLDWSSYPKQLPQKPLVEPPWKHDGVVSHLNFSTDGKRLATSCDDGMVRVFDVRNGLGLTDVKVNGTPNNPLNVKAPTRKMRFSPTDADLVVGGAGYSKLVWFYLSGDREALYQDHTKDVSQRGPFIHGSRAAVFDVAFRPDGKQLASIGTDGLCLIWDVATARTVSSLPTAIRGRLFDVDWRQIGDKSLLALVGEDGWFELWDMADGLSPKKSFAVEAHQGPAWGVTFDPLGEQVLTWSRDIAPIENAITNPSGEAAQWSAAPDAKPDFTAAIWNINAALRKGPPKHP